MRNMTVAVIAFAMLAASSSAYAVPTGGGKGPGDCCYKTSTKCKPNTNFPCVDPYQAKTNPYCKPICTKVTKKVCGAACG